MNLPYSLESEKQVLANMIFSTEALLDAVSRLQAEDFYDDKNRIIFVALREIYNTNKAKVEPTSLISYLQIAGELEKVGDASYVLELVNSYTDITNSNYYIKTIEETSALRKIVLYAQRIVSSWEKEAEGNLENYLNKIEKEITDITKQRQIASFVSVENAVSNFKIKLQNLSQDQNAFKGLLTGYEHFDNVLLGFKNGEVTVLAARPSIGKSAFALNLLYRVSQRTNKPCVMFSLEMGVETLTNRMLSLISGVRIRSFQTGKLNKEEKEKAALGMRELSERNIFFDDTPAIKVIEMRAKLNKLMASRGPLGLIVVDYIGLVSPDVTSQKSSESRTVEVGKISAALKSLARDFNCPVLFLAQLNRDVEKNAKGDRISREPKLSDLRESGAIEQDADVVMFIHKIEAGKTSEDATNESSANPDDETNTPVKIMIAKQRNGMQCNIDFMFQKHIGRFLEMDKEED